MRSDIQSVFLHEHGGRLVENGTNKSLHRLIKAHIKRAFPKMQFTMFSTVHSVVACLVTTAYNSINTVILL